MREKKYRDALEMPIFESPVILGFDPDFPKEEPEMWAEMWEDDIARSIYLAISRWYLRSQHFLPGVIRIANFVRFKPPTDVLDMLNYFRQFGGDAPLVEPFKVVYDVGGYLSFRENPRYREQRLQRELRLRELLQICQNKRHLEWEVRLPKPPAPKYVEVVSGVELETA